MKVVIDTNALLVMLPSTSTYHVVYQLLQIGVFEVYVTGAILLEYEEQLKYRYGLDSVNAEMESLLAYPNVNLIQVDFHWNLITVDPDDNKFVDCAVAANADFIVTNDKHFGILKSIDFPKVNTLTLQSFLQMLSQPFNATS